MIPQFYISQAAINDVVQQDLDLIASANLTTEQMDEIADTLLQELYPDAMIEAGENWQLIAQTFFQIGFMLGTANGNGNLL